MYNMEERKRVCDGTESEGRSVSYCIFDLFYILLFYRENCSTVLPGYFTFSEKLKCYDTVTATATVR